MYKMGAFKIARGDEKNRHRRVLKGQEGDEEWLKGKIDQFLSMKQDSRRNYSSRRKEIV